VKLSNAFLTFIERLVDIGLYSTKAEVIRDGVRLLMKKYENVVKKK
jgi:putative addiction module CopG family antidote